MPKKTVKDIDIKNKKVIMRADFNVPLDDQKKVTDDARIAKTVPTIEYILSQGASLVLMSHLGRPKGKRDDAFSLKPVAARLSELLKKDVKILNDCIGEEVKSVCAQLRPGEVVLLENVRFYAEEEANDDGFAKQLSELAEIYVNDAFGTAHRAHASTEGIARHLPAVAGFLIEKELKFLGDTLENPEQPFVAILGGAKISGKIDVVQNLLPKVDTLIIGGGMAYTFFVARKVDVGNSLVETDKIGMAKEILKSAIENDKRLMLPIDHIAADKFDKDAQVVTVPRTCIDDGWQGMDIGPETIIKFERAIKKAKTIFWNGPMGVFEFPRFANGTYAIARIVAEATKNGATSIIGGGDSAAAIAKAGLTDEVSHVSTGGGASLEFVEGKPLPGVEALMDK